MTSMLLAAFTSHAIPQRVYAVSWRGEADASAERRALIDQIDRQLRDEFSRRGARVADDSAAGAIVLRPSLEIFPRALKLNLVGVRSGALLGTISTRVAGSNRAAQVRALISRTCDEADQLR
jgi:hypothetical protein